MEWWNGTLEWNAGIKKVHVAISFTPLQRVVSIFRQLTIIASYTTANSPNTLHG